MKEEEEREDGQHLELAVEFFGGLGGLVAFAALVLLALFALFALFLLLGPTAAATEFGAASLAGGALLALAALRGARALVLALQPVKALAQRAPLVLHHTRHPARHTKPPVRKEKTKEKREEKKKRERREEKRRGTSQRSTHLQAKKENLGTNNEDTRFSTFLVFFDCHRGGHETLEYRFRSSRISHSHQKDPRGEAIASFSLFFLFFFFFFFFFFFSFFFF
jgi:hypothetical protein